MPKHNKGLLKEAHATCSESQSVSSSQPFKVVQSVELQSSAEHGKAKPKLKAGSEGSVLSESQLSETAANSDKSDLETSRVSVSLRQRPMRSEVALNRWRP